MCHLYHTMCVYVKLHRQQTNTAENIIRPTFLMFLTFPCFSCTPSSPLLPPLPSWPTRRSTPTSSGPSRQTTLSTRRWSSSSTTTTGAEWGHSRRTSRGSPRSVGAFVFSRICAPLVFHFDKRCFAKHGDARLEKRNLPIDSITFIRVDYWRIVSSSWGLNHAAAALWCQRRATMAFSSLVISKMPTPIVWVAHKCIQLIFQILELDLWAVVKSAYAHSRTHTLTPSQLSRQTHTVHEWLLRASKEDLHFGFKKNKNKAQSVIRRLFAVEEEAIFKRKTFEQMRVIYPFVQKQE